MLKKGDKIAIVGCSNAQKLTYKENIDNLIEIIRNIGLEPVCSQYIYEKSSVFSGTGKERGEALMDFYLNPEITAIFDISGGDVGNEVLEYLDFNEVKENFKPFFGYSDLTTVINAIYAQTKMPSYLYQIRNLIYEYKDIQKQRFENSLFDDKDDLFNIDYDFIQGNNMEGTIIGGNIRCFLKLAGTKYMPDFKEKILLLESLGGEVGLMTTHLNQLKQMGAFNEVSGILLGTFTTMQEKKHSPTIEELVQRVVHNEKLPIAKTEEIGHGSNSKCIIIGSTIKLSKC